MKDIPFSVLDGSTGKVLSSTVLRAADIKACPTFVLWAAHYREDGTCRHDEVICEEEGCDNPKFEDEIFCELHCGY